MIDFIHKNKKIIITIISLLIPEIVLLILGMISEIYPQILLQGNLLIAIYIATWIVPIYFIYKIWFKNRKHKVISEE